MKAGPLVEDLQFRTEDVYESVGDRVGAAVESAQSYLLSLQAADGHWCGELEGDTIVESEYLLTLYLLGRSGEARARKAAEYIRRQQLPPGGWAVYPGGPPEVSASVKAYFVLKLMGDDPEAPHMVRARDVILGLGGIEACNSFTRIYLSIFGQCGWEDCPAVPPELILLPDWFPLNIYRISSWSRAIVVPLSIIWARKPSCPVPDHANIGELHRPEAPVKPRRPAGGPRQRLWTTFFRAANWALKAMEAASLTPLRAKALRTAEAWIQERLEGSDGLGAILPPIINTVIAFRCLGYPLDHPLLVSQVRELEKLEIEDADTLRIQPCFSATWDTALALQALLESGLPAAHPALEKGTRWLLDREARGPGDYQRRNPEAEPGGWFFEYRNPFYPDADDTTAALTTLSRLRLTPPASDQGRRDALDRGLRWLFSMQNTDGGWGAFDKGCDNEILTFIPFADHNAMIDPSCEDITGRGLEALHHLGVPPDSAALRRAIAFLRAKQAPDGTWYGRWGCNYLYGTWLALRGLAQVGEDLSQERYQRAAAWLYRCQNEDGGWGELPTSYDDPARKGIGPSTASQTSWALLALFALNHSDSPGVRRALEYLLRTQGPDGSWRDDYWTGTGFPKVFYLRYHLYAVYSPLLALGIFQSLNMLEGTTAPFALIEEMRA
jgi:squalene-hopene/tetraprenyl-beta-curcumene cyclase